MPRKKSSLKGKRKSRKAEAKAPDAEWAFVEERFGSCSVDFNELARMFTHQ